MARRIRDTNDPEFRQFTRRYQIAKRDLKELAPEAASRETIIIHGDVEARVVTAYLVAKARDRRAGGTAHMEAFRRNRQAVRILREVVSRIPIQPDTAMSG